jgi:hypothetical protein
MARTVRVREKSRPRIFFQLFPRDPRLSAVPIDVTGFALRFIVKRDLEDSDANALFDTLATIDGLATSGTFRVDLTLEHTGLVPGRYPGEIRWWDDGVQTKPPTDAETVSYVVDEAVDKIV